MTNTELDMRREQLAKEIVFELPEGGLGANEKMGIVQNSMQQIRQRLQESNVQYDSQRESGIPEGEAIVDYTLKVFSMAFEISDSFGYAKLQDRILAAQKMTDVVMKKESPMSEKQGQFGEVAEGYIIKNAHLFLKELQTAPTAVQNLLAQAFEEANKAYNASQVEREQIPILTLGEQVNEIIPPVKKEQKLEVPVKRQ